MAASDRIGPAYRRSETPGTRRTTLLASTLLLLVLLLVCTVPSATAQMRAPAQSPAELSRLAEQVEIRRTLYGVPHILAENLRAFGFGLAYVQIEDYGQRVPEGLIEARGELARHLGYDEIDSDFVNRRTYARAVETYHLVPEDTRAILEGFAAGVNYYVALHPDEFPDWIEPEFTGYDVAARDIRGPSLGDIRDFLERLEPETDSGEVARAGTADNPWRLAARHVQDPHPDAGSNAWALAASRTESGNAILLRNPHLSWSSGYYEAHATVPGVLNFYGDFRLGGPFSTIGGFNEHLGWATTNNGPDLDEVYALEVDPERPDHYLFNGASLPIRREEVTVEFRNGDGVGRETRVFLETPLGPVIHRGGGKIYVYHATLMGEHRSGTQLLRMMQAENLEEWKAAMAMLADPNSNYTYADGDGNAFLVWNAAVPVLPHPYGGDSTAVPAAGLSDVWTRIVPFDQLPQFLNPDGGYVQNSNDSFHFTNLNEILDPEDFPANFPDPEFDLRSQLSILLIGGDDRLSLEEVVRRKHNMRMLLADRVKADLIEAVRDSDPAPDVAEAIALIERWDNTVAAESRGGALFKTWWWRYVDLVEADDTAAAAEPFGAPPESPFEEPWTAEKPMGTPHGLSDPARAAAAFAWAVEETARRWGSWDVAWGEVHRVRRGDVDVPVGGCTGALGCFRVLWYEEAEDGKLVARGGDGWVIAIEFSETPRAYSVLAYGESSQEESPHFDDQAAMFARGEMKVVAFTEDAIDEQLIRSYHPGEELRAAARR